MQLKCKLEKVDFIPTIKIDGKTWQPKKTLVNGTVLDVEDLIGHQLLAAHPGAFEVLGYGEKKTRNKQVTKENLQHVDSGEIAE